MKSNLRFRENFMPKKMLTFIFALFAGFVFTQAYADSPNRYVCKGDGVSLTYTTIAFGPVTPDTVYLTLFLGNKKYTAGNKNIETHKSVMGDVKSITYKILPDVEIKKASFILPEINLGTNFVGNFIDRVNFKSQLALTTIATPFAPPPFVGIVNKSSYIDLNCTAILITPIPL